MKILIIHQHFKTPQTGGAIRSYFLAKALVERGHTAMVITAHNEQWYKHLAIEGVDAHYLPIPYDNKFGFYARGWSFLRFIVQTARLAGKLRPFDLCYAISVPLTVGLVARWIKFRYSIPYLFEVGDLWPDAPIQMGFIRNFFFKRWLFSVERTSYRSANAMVALSPSIQTTIQKRAPAKTVHMVPNMADCDYYLPEEKSPSVVRKFGVDGKLVISYIGAIGVANGLDYVLECADLCRKEGLPVHFIVCGEGALRERLRHNAQQLGLQNISFPEFVNREGVKEIMNVTDAVIVCYKNVPILETGSPNKYFDGLAAGKLIVINFGGWIRKDIEEHRCGIYVDPNQPADFVKKIRPLIGNQRILQEFQRSARALAEKKYDRKNLSEAWVKILFNSQSARSIVV